MRNYRFHVIVNGVVCATTKSLSGALRVIREMHHPEKSRFYFGGRRLQLSTTDKTAVRDTHHARLATHEFRDSFGRWIQDPPPELISARFPGDR